MAVHDHAVLWVDFQPCGMAHHVGRKLGGELAAVSIAPEKLCRFTAVCKTDESEVHLRGVLHILKDPPHNYAQTIHIIPADQNFEKKRSSSALFAREINLVTQPSFDCEQGINSQVQTACSNADAIFPVLGIVSCRNERFSLSRKTHVQLWNEPRISHVRLL